MPLSNVQKGAIGQFAFLAAALVTGKGEVEVYTPAADDEGRDAEVRRHLGRAPAIGIQVKVAFVTFTRGRRTRYLVIRFSLPVARVASDPRLWYFFAFYDQKQLGLANPCYLVPSDVLYRIGRQKQVKGKVWFEFETNLDGSSHDQWSSYRVAPSDLGSRLLEIIAAAPQTASLRATKLLPDSVLVAGVRRQTRRGSNRAA